METIQIDKCVRAFKEGRGKILYKLSGGGFAILVSLSETTGHGQTRYGFTYLNRKCTRAVFVHSTAMKSVQAAMRSPEREILYTESDLTFTAI